MNAERWQHIKTIVYSALPLPEPERSTYITHACGDDELLRQEIEQLLQGIEESEDARFMVQPAFDSDKFISDLSDKWQSVSSHEDLIGEQIGPYRITEQLGTGGMGSVFKGARSDGQFHQQVAIKLIRKGVDTEENIQRFRMEQEILARLHHPHIAQLYDGGVTNDSIPYLVMEFVDGIPIDEYCNKHRLTIDERIELFRDVCSAVQYAHGNLVIHRDLKTENIYVTPEGAVKVLDFGVAKLLSPELTEMTLLETRPGQKLWTPQYAAPEQVQGEAITIATDVYALGVLLHKLLADTYPLDLSGKEIAEIEQMIMEASPVAPSQSLDVNAEKKTAKNRSISSSELKKLLSGDLDALVGKAVRKEPEYRYRSVSQLLDDIERYQNGLPLIARNDTVQYRVGKFMRRHKIALTTAVVFLILAISAVTFYTWKITKERDRAEQVTQFLTNIFNESNPMQASEDSLTVRQVLDAGAERVENELADQPDLQAKMQSVIGEVYFQLGLYNKAERLLELAKEKQEQFSGSQIETDLAKTLLVLARVKDKLDKYDDAEQLSRQALVLFEKHRGKKASETQASLLLLRDILFVQEKYEEASLATEQWIERVKVIPPEKSIQYADQLMEASYHENGKRNFDKAEQMLWEAFDIKTSLLGENHAQVADVLDKLSATLFANGKYEEAKQMQIRAVNIYRKENPAQLPAGLWSLARFLTFRGEYEQADTLFREAINKRKELTENSYDVLGFQFSYAGMLLQSDQFAKAKILFEEIYQENKNQYGDQHLATIRALEYKAHTLKDQGAFSEAAILYRQVLQQLDDKLGESHYLSASARLGYGHLLILQGEPKEAEQWIRDAIDLFSQYKDKFGHQNVSNIEYSSYLGLSLKEQGRFAEAEPLLLESYQSLNKRRGPNSNVTKSVLGYLISLYEDWGKPEKLLHIKNDLMIADGTDK